MSKLAEEEKHLLAELHVRGPMSLKLFPTAVFQGEGSGTGNWLPLGAPLCQPNF